ncbi:MAG: beta-ketoacyl-ACP synthase [Polyangiales bacterium]
MIMSRRVVVTGIGVTSPIGNSVAESVAALREGRHGVRFMPEWGHISDLQGRLGATVEGLDLKTLYPRKKRRTMGKVAMFAVHSTEQAVEQSGLDKETLESERTGVAFGSTSGSGSETEAFSTPLALHKTMKGLESNSYFRLMTHTCAVNVGHFYRVRGRIVPMCTACTSGSQGIGTGYELIREGHQDVMLCGGAEEMHYTTAVTFDLLMATSTKYNERPDGAPRPFDASRDGLVIGEGAGAVVLESYEHAAARGADILAEVLGYASNCDGAHLTMPSQDGMRRVMELSLQAAGLSPDDVDYVNGHGTGTEIGDITESRATRELFGRAVPYSTQKGYVGHTLGACGAMETAWTIEMMRNGWIAPCRNLEELDSRCGELDYVREPREAKLGIVMKNNFAFGGINTSILLGPPPTS